MDEDIFKQKTALPDLDLCQQQPVGHDKKHKTDENKFIVAESQSNSTQSLMDFDNSRKEPEPHIPFVPSPSGSDTTVPLENSEYQRELLEVIDEDSEVGEKEVQNEEEPSTLTILEDSNCMHSTPVTETGVFAFVDSGCKPSSMLKSSPPKSRPPMLSPTLPKISLNDETLPSSMCEADSSAVASDIEAVFPDRVSFSSSPTELSTDTDFRNSCNLQPSVVGSDINASNSSGTAKILHGSVGNQLISVDRDCVPSSSQISCDMASPGHLQFAIQDRERYIPLDVSIEYLEKQEKELRKKASEIKNVIERINAQLNQLDGEKELVKSNMTEQKADISLRSNSIESLYQTSARNKEELAQYEEKSRMQNDITQQVGKKVTSTELALHEMQVEILKEKLKTGAYDSVNLTVAQSEKIEALKEDIKKYQEEYNVAKEDLTLLNNQLKKCTEKDNAQRLRIEEIEAQQKKTEELLLENTKKLHKIKCEMHRLSKEIKWYSASFVDQERRLVKIKTCRKLKLLDLKEERILGNELTVLKRSFPQNSRTSSNIQYSSQVTFFGGNCQSNSLDTAASRASSMQQFTRLEQSVSAIHNVTWSSLQSHVVMPPRFPTNLMPSMGSTTVPSAYSLLDSHHNP